jgi:hypothetical protein
MMLLQKGGASLPVLLLGDKSNFTLHQSNAVNMTFCDLARDIVYFCPIRKQGN